MFSFLLYHTNIQTHEINEKRSDARHIIPGSSRIIDTRTNLAGKFKYNSDFN